MRNWQPQNAGWALLFGVVLTGCAGHHAKTVISSPSSHHAQPAKASPVVVELSTTQGAYRWDGRLTTRSFPGDVSQQKLRIAALTANSANADTTTLLLAASTAEQLRQTEDAGFLLNAAQVRLDDELNRFPPRPGQRDWLTRIRNFRLDVSQRVNAALLDKPGSHAAVARRLARWRCETSSGHMPAWRHVQGGGPARGCQALVQARLEMLRGQAMLLADPTYADAIQLLRYYQDSSASVRQLPGLADQRRKALEDLVRIERSKGLVGFSRRFGATTSLD